MKILFVSDPHFENFPDFATPDASPDYPGINSRMFRILEAFMEAVRYAHEQGINRIFVPGDVFHRRGIINVPVFNAVSKVFAKASEIGIAVHVMAGNHDVVDRYGRRSYEGLHALYSMGNAIVYNEPCVTGLGTKTPFCVIPYTASREEWIHHAKALIEMKAAERHSHAPILIAHQSFVGARTGPHEFIMREGIDPEKDIPEGYAAVVSGHYHQNQVIQSKPTPVLYVGGLLQHNFGEMNYKPGWIVYDEEKESFEHVENTVSPRFKIVKANNPDFLTSLKAPDSPDYVRVEWTGKPEVFHEFCRGVEPLPTVSLKLVEPEGAQPSRLSLSGTEASTEILARYVAYMESAGKLPAGVSKEGLLAYGVKMLTEGTRSGSV